MIKNNLSKRLSGGNLENALDLIDTLLTKNTQIDTNGYVTCYHRTNEQSAKEILTTGIMKAKEDGLFFSTKPNGYADGYGNIVLKFNIPVELLLLDDIFDDEAHLRIPLKKPPWQYNISQYIIGEETMNKKPIDKSKKSNIKCEHCRFFEIGTDNAISNTNKCTNSKSPKYGIGNNHYWNRCKCFDWK